MSTVVTVEFECCGDVIDMPTALRDDQTLLGNATLADTLIGWAEALHSDRHPECSA